MRFASVWDFTQRGIPKERRSQDFMKSVKDALLVFKFNIHGSVHRSVNQ